MALTEETTSIGRLIAGVPEAGSVTLALFTRAPLWLLRAPFILIRPSGPRTTPGTSGSKLSNRWFALGASAMVSSEMVAEDVETSASFWFPVTVTEVVTVTRFISRGTFKSAPDGTEHRVRV